MTSPYLYVLTGPTAVGKTELGLVWAEANGAEILYCDSTALYQGMDVGTAKPTKAEQARVPHHGLDCVPVGGKFTIKDYVALALQVVKAVAAKGKPLLITGGSGFYLKTFFAPVLDAVEVPDEVSMRVKQIGETEGLKGWLRLLKEKSPEGFGRLDIHNPRRVSKALERVLTTGKSLPVLEAEWDLVKSPFEGYIKRVCLLERSAEVLKARIAARAKAMMEAGLIKEVEYLITQGLLENVVACNTIGYRETIAFLKGEITTKEALEALIIKNTTQLLKKQRTFFRNQIPVDYTMNLDDPLKGEVRGNELFPVADLEA